MNENDPVLIQEVEMNTKEPFFPQPDGFSTVDQGTGSSAIRALATQDHAVIRQWAARRAGDPR